MSKQFSMAEYAKILAQEVKLLTELEEENVERLKDLVFSCVKLYGNITYEKDLTKVDKKLISDVKFKSRMLTESEDETEEYRYKVLNLVRDIKKTQ